MMPANLVGPRRSDVHSRFHEGCIKPLYLSTEKIPYCVNLEHQFTRRPLGGALASKRTGRS